MNAELPQFWDRLLVALLNGGYQGLLVTAAVWVGLKLLPRTNAATRYAVWGLSLVAVIALPFLHFALERRSTAPDWLSTNLMQESVGNPAATAPERVPTSNNGPLLAGGPRDVVTSPSTGIAQRIVPPNVLHHGGLESGTGDKVDEAPLVKAPDPASEQPFVPFVYDSALVLECGEAPLALDLDSAEETGDPGATSIRDSSSVFGNVGVVSSPGAELSAVTRTTGTAASDALIPPDAKSSPSRRPATHMVPFALPRFAAPAILMALALLGAVRIVALIRQLLLLREVKTASEAAPDSLSRCFDSICLSARRKRPAKLLVSLETNSPMVVGFLRPAILLPKHLVETLQPAQLDPILRHELAHVRRFDDWSNLAQQGVKALFGFHPAVIWICRRLSIEREIACDDYVLHSGKKARDYAMFLTEFASHKNRRSWSAAPAAWSRKTQLKERINMILKTNRSISPRLGFARLGILSTSSAALAFAMLQLAPRLSVAGQPAFPKTPVASVQSADSTTIVGPSGKVLVVTDVNVDDPSVAVVVADPTTPSPRVAISGPRAKSAPRAPEAVSAEAAPIVEEATVPEVPPAPGKLPHAPLPPDAKRFGPAPDRIPNGSLEERLSRVEQMLESLVQQKSMKIVVPKPIPHPDGKPEMNAFSYEWKMAHPDITWEKQAKQMEMQAEVFRQNAERDAKRAAEALTMDKSGKSLVGSNDKLLAARAKLEQQRRALESQRAALEKQLEVIESQCEKIEQEQEKLQEEREKQEEMKRENHNTSDNDNEDECDELASH